MVSMSSEGAAIVYEAPNSTAIFDRHSPNQAENLLMTIAGERSPLARALHTAFQH
jgi:hypothetical protein